MKKAIILFLFVFTAGWAGAQLNISTKLRQDAVWDGLSEDWEVLSTDESVTFFEFNKDFTLFKHTTPTITSTYQILNWDYNDSLVRYTMNVRSDVGNEYEMIIDAMENCVAFFFWRNDDYILVRHTIKDSWIKE